MPGMRLSSFRSVALRLRLTCTLLLLTVAGVAGGNGQAAPLLWQVSDPDLCALLPTGTGPVTLEPGVGKPRSTVHCSITYNSQSRKVSSIVIDKYLNPQMAHQFVTEQYSNRSNNSTTGEPMWSPATAYGDPGFSYNVPAWTSPYSNEVTGGSVFFARGCYVVQGDAGHDPDDISKGLDPGPLRETITAIDRQLQKAPCGGAVTPPNTSEDMPIFITRTDCPSGSGQPAFRVAISWAPKDVRDYGIVTVIEQTGDEISTRKTTNHQLGQDFIVNYGTTIVLPKDNKLADNKWSIYVTPIDAAGKDRGEMIGHYSGSLALPCGSATISSVKEGLVRVLNKSSQVIKEGQAAVEVIQDVNTLIEVTGVKPPLQTAFGQVDKKMAILAGLIDDPQTFDTSFSVDSRNAALTKLTVYSGQIRVTPKNHSLQPMSLKAGEHIEVSQTSVSPISTVVEVPGTGVFTFPETGKTSAGLFLNYWSSHGGLAQQGYPISNLIRETSDLNKQVYTVQYYERAVFEFHPEYAPPNDVLLSQLGTFQYKRKYPQGAPNQKANQANGNFFKETGHWVGGRFWKYWQEHGGLAQQGYPLSDEFTEVSETNGKPYLVQYFERAVFEYHPEFAPPNDVLLSLLGVSFYNQKYVIKGTPTTVPVATAPAATRTVPPPGPSATATKSSAACLPKPSGMLLGLTGDGTTADASGNGNSGVAKGNATYTNGKVGQAFSFNGSSGYVEVPDKPAWAFGSKDFTIDLWVNFTHLNGINALVANDEGPGITNKWIFWVNGGFLQLHVNGPYAADINGGQFQPNASEWHHVAVTRSGATFTFYVDGVARPPATESRAIPDANAPLTVGQAEGQFFSNGLEDELHIFSRALSGSEIQAIYNSGQVGVCR